MVAPFQDQDTFRAYPARVVAGNKDQLYVSPRELDELADEFYTHQARVAAPSPSLVSGAWMQPVSGTQHEVTVEMEGGGDLAEYLEDAHNGRRPRNAIVFFYRAHEDDPLATVTSYDGSVDDLLDDATSEEGYR